MAGTATRTADRVARAKDWVVHAGRIIPPGAKITRGEELPDYAFDSAIEHGHLTEDNKVADSAATQEKRRKAIVAQQQAGRSEKGATPDPEKLSEASPSLEADSDDEFVEVPD